MKSKTQKEKLLKEKLEKYKARLAAKKLGYAEVVRTRFGDSYEDQLRDDTNALELIINSIKIEIESLHKT